MSSEVAAPPKYLFAVYRRVNVLDLGSLGIRIARNENLPVLPTVVIEILKMYNSNNVNVRSLEKVIEKDPAMSAKVMKVAGSSIYAVKHVNTVNKALSVLGMNTIRSMALSLAVQQLVQDRKRKMSFDHQGLWRHSLAVAIGSKAIMKRVNPAHSEEMYVAGLMHDIGYLVLDRFAAEELKTAIQMASSEVIPIAEAVKRTLGFDHRQVGGLLADKWQLSAIVAHTIRNCEQPEKEALYKSQVEVASAANFLAYYSGFPTMPGIPGNPKGLDHLSLLDLPQKTIDDIVSEIMIEVDNVDDALHSVAA